MSILVGADGLVTRMVKAEKYRTVGGVVLAAVVESMRLGVADRRVVGLKRCERISRLAGAQWVDYRKAQVPCRRTSLEVVLDGMKARSKLLAGKERIEVWVLL